MDDSMAQAGASASAEPQASGQPAWQVVAATIAAVLLAAIFLVSGLWKLTNPLATSERMAQMLVPRQLALVAALGVGMCETLAGVLVLVPLWRRWGAWLCGALLVVFMIYIGVNYNALTGADCSCFPWLKRLVGPGFFVGDALMLLLTVPAWLWSKPSRRWEYALAALVAIGVFAGSFYGYDALRNGGVVAPAAISVDGKAFPLREGRVFVFFFDPECAHCYAAAKDFATYRWKTDVQLVATATTQPQWGAIFLKRTGFNARLTQDAKALRAAFRFTDPPYAVALEDGRLKQALRFFDDVEPRKSLKAIGWIE
jgi:uncharacterized membrane protein YphA (DoxX/SURF4 family)